MNFNFFRHLLSLNFLSLLTDYTFADLRIQQVWISRHFRPWSVTVLIKRSSLEVTAAGSAVCMISDSSHICERSIGFPPQSEFLDVELYGKLGEYNSLIVIAESATNHNIGKFIDTYYLNICPLDPYYFNDTAPEWANQTISRSTESARCIDNKPRSPSSFIPGYFTNCDNTKPLTEIDCKKYRLSRLPRLQYLSDSCEATLYNPLPIPTFDGILQMYDQDLRLIREIFLFAFEVQGEEETRKLCSPTELIKLAQILIIIKPSHGGPHDLPEVYVIKRCPCPKYPFEELAPQFRDAPVEPGHDCSQVKVCDDPHFVQTIFDITSNDPIRICYDVTGQSQQSIFILEDKHLNVKIEGVLLDDYYIHEILVKSDKNLININRKRLEYGEKSCDWMENGLILLEGIRIEINKNTSMKIEINNDDNEKLIIFVKRSTNEFGLEHLDVSFGELRREKDRYGGIIGSIDGKEVVMLENGIQNEEDVLVKIDEEEIRGKWKIRLNSKCILLPFEKLIKKENIHKFIY